MTEQIGRLQANQEHQKEAILSLERYKWHHIGLTVSGIVFSAVVLIGVGGMYFSLDNKLSVVEYKLESRIVAVENRIAAVENKLENRIADVEQQMATGFAELKVLITKKQNGAEVTAFTRH